MQYALGIIAGYLAGSLPFAYLAGKLLAGKDLSTTGTGNLGTHNVFHEVGKAAGVTVFFLDCAKMGFTLLICQAVGASLLAQSLTALAVIVGHNWSCFTRFRGGRGMTVTLVGAAILLPWETLVVISVLGFGLLVDSLALYCGLALVLWPLLALWRGEPSSLLLYGFGAMGIGFMKRLQGSPAVASSHGFDVPLGSILANRLFYDREPPVITGPNGWWLEPAAAFDDPQEEIGEAD